MPDALTYLREHRAEHLAALKELCRIPSVSAQTNHKPDVARAAEWLASRLRRAGVKAVEILPTGGGKGNPVVYCEVPGPKGASTVLVYGHYDVQPPDPLAEWKTPPFEPTERDGHLWGRGVVDDKGQLMVHVNAIEAMLATAGVPCTLKVLFEGEEEVGSEHLDAFLEANRKRLACDLALVSDTSMYDREHPALTYSLRGLCYFQVDVTGPKNDLHSGSYGGAVPNPGEALVQILAACKDPKTGRVLVPGFYDDVAEPTEFERKMVRSLPFDEKRIFGETGVTALNGEQGYSPLERLWLRPTFEVNGLASGYEGEGAKTIIPAKAMAKVSMRLVANQEPERVRKAFEAHVARLAPKGLTVKVSYLSGGRPSKVPVDHPAIQAGLAALEKAFGKKAVVMGEGGSIPVVASFDRIFKVPTVLLGFGLPGENAHAPNENLLLENYEKGGEVAVLFLHSIAKKR